MNSAARRLLAFTALALFVSITWVEMVAPAPVLRAALACLPVVAVAAVIALVVRARAGRIRDLAAGAALLAAVALGMVIIGLPARLLLPAGWSEFGVGIDVGSAGIGTGLDYPYGGPNEWARLLILIAAPLIVGIAAALTFLPLGRAAGAPRLLGLAVLVTGYGVAVTSYGADLVVLRGVALLGAVIAWLWLPTLRRRDAIGVGALVLLAVGAAVFVTVRLEDRPALVDYDSWSWAAGVGISFEWDHSYGPIPWDRSGDTMMLVQSDQPNYWKLSVLDRFDGRGWVRSELVRPSLELPERAGPGAEPDGAWRATVGVTIGELRGNLVPGPGTDRRVLSGIDATASADSSVLWAPELSAGDAYLLRAYTPDPDAEQMRAVGWRVPERFAEMTAIAVPDRAGGPTRQVTTLGIASGGAAQAQAVIAASPYARMAGLAQRLTATAPTAYDAVKAVEAHLLRGYTYSEDPPQRPLPLLAFLFGDRIGYCQQFSGAMALLLRMRGIPARVATGFSPGQRDGADTYRVRDLDAHSWVEVYFAGIGWVPFDPTPPASPAELRTGGPLSASSAASSLAPLLRGAQAFGFGLPLGAQRVRGGETRRGGDPTAATTTGGRSAGIGRAVALLATLLLVAALLALGPGLSRRIRQRRLAPDHAAGIRVAELERAVRGVGFGPAPGATLLDLEVALRSRREPLPARYVQKLRALRYQPPGSSRPLPSSGERRALRRRLAANAGLRGRLVAYRAIPPLSPRGR